MLQFGGFHKAEERSRYLNAGSRRGKVQNRELQDKLFEIFIYVREICEKHGLRYFAIGGTCIGAVRHHGFIPWDDDLDIAMPDRDYEEFLRIAPKELPEHLAVMDFGENICARIHNVNTTLVEVWNPDKYNSGVFIDIMPFYGVPERRRQQIWLGYKVRFLLKLYQKQKSRLCDNRRIAGKLLWLIMKPFHCLAGQDFYPNLWTCMVSKRDFDSSRYTGFTWSYHLEKRIFERAWFDSYEEFPFESTTIRCPAGWDAYLTKHFGDYRTIPPQSEQVSKHIYFLDLNVSYKKYQKKGRKGEGQHGNRLYGRGL